MAGLKAGDVDSRTAAEYHWWSRMVSGNRNWRTLWDWAGSAGGCPRSATKRPACHKRPAGKRRDVNAYLMRAVESSANCEATRHQHGRRQVALLGSKHRLTELKSKLEGGASATDRVRAAEESERTRASAPPSRRGALSQAGRCSRMPDAELSRTGSQDDVAGRRGAPTRRRPSPRAAAARAPPDEQPSAVRALSREDGAVQKGVRPWSPTSTPRPPPTHQALAARPHETARNTHGAARRQAATRQAERLKQYNFFFKWLGGKSGGKVWPPAFTPLFPPIHFKIWRLRQYNSFSKWLGGKSGGKGLAAGFPPTFPPNTF